MTRTRTTPKKMRNSSVAEQRRRTETPRRSSSRYPSPRPCCINPHAHDEQSMFNGFALIEALGIAGSTFLGSSVSMKVGERVKNAADRE